MTPMSERYQQAMAKSYANRETMFVINHDRLGEIVEIPLGFQPLGIASIKTGRDEDTIAIAAYLKPEVCLACVTRGHIGLQFDVSWIRGVEYEDSTYCLFPDIFADGEANRAQTVNFGPNGTLWVSRNGDREFFILHPPAQTGGKWTLTDRFRLPGQGDMHSALLINPDVKEPSVVTVESGADLESWSIGRYELMVGTWERIEGRAALPPYVYGIGINPRCSSEDCWLVTDYRLKGRPGVMKWWNLVLPGVYGNGICFLSDGSALVTRYGLGHPGAFDGVPGALIYIPSKFLL